LSRTQEKFEEFLEDTERDGAYIYMDAIQRMASKGSSSLYVDFFDILGYDYTLADELKQHFDAYRQQLSEVVLQKLKLTSHEYAGTIETVHVRFINFPAETAIHEITASKLYELTQVSGTVIQFNERQKHVSVMAYRCPVCATIMNVQQTEQWRIPVEKCVGCDNRKGFIIDHKNCTHEDYRWVTIQQLMDEVPSGRTPEQLKILLKTDITEMCIPGDDIVVVGVPKVLEKKPNSMALELSHYLDANSVIKLGERDYSQNLSEERKQELRVLAAAPEHLANVVKSYAPTIYGEDLVKEALAYQQCEGVVKKRDKRRKRGQFHILLAGPPGVGKSELGDYSYRYHVKGRKVAGKGSSGVGVTASVVKEGDEWVLKAGAMVLADLGFLFVDEIEKMSPEDSAMMHPGMAQQEVPIAKAGINAIPKTRCSVLASANPIAGIWDNYKTVIDNLHSANKGLALTLLNRFALIFIMKGSANIDEEEAVVEHILEVDTNPGSLNPPYNFDTLRHLFTYARTFTPKLSPEARGRIKMFYMNLYKASQAENTMIISRRQPEDLIRISEASAKLHLRDTVTEEDADNAIRVFAGSLKQFGLDPSTGKIDQGILLYGVPKSRQQRLQSLPTMLTSFLKLNPGERADKNEFITFLVGEWKVSRDEAKDLILLATRDGVVFSPTVTTIDVT